MSYRDDVHDVSHGSGMTSLRPPGLSLGLGLGKLPGGPFVVGKLLTIEAGT